MQDVSRIANAVTKVMASNFPRVAVRAVLTMTVIMIGFHLLGGTAHAAHWVRDTVWVEPHWSYEWHAWIPGHSEPLNSGHWYYDEHVDDFGNVYYE